MLFTANMSNKGVGAGAIGVGRLSWLEVGGEGVILTKFNIRGTLEI